MDYISKQDIIDQIAAALTNHNITCEVGTSSDLVINLDLADSSWSTGNKKASYQASVLLDEKNQTIYLWELTSEQGSGLSWGSDKQSYTQKGSALFRQVSTTQYGAEGRVTNYDLNLGKVPHIIKEAAAANGWKVKSVLSRKKASYAITPSDKVKAAVSPGWWILWGLSLLLMVTFFGLVKVTAYGWILGVVTLSLPILVREKIAAKGKILSFLTWPTILAVLFVIMVFTSPDTKSTTASSLKLGKPTSFTVSPQNKMSSYTYNQIAVELPAGTVKSKTKLIICPVLDNSKPFPQLQPVCKPVDIKLGDLRLFKNPLILKIPYDKTRMRDISPENGFTAVYFNEQTKQWSDIPYTVDTTRHTVNLQLYHLTAVQCYYSRWEGARVYDDGTSTVVFSLDAESRRLFNEYDNVNKVISAEPTVPQLVKDCASIVSQVVQVYRSMGLTLNGKPKVYLLNSKGNKYNSVSGNICITLDSATYTNARNMFMRNIAHELFHRAQSDTLGWYTYTRTNSKDTSFWMEACADYMANTGVWLALGLPPIDAYDQIKKTFFDQALTAFDSSHEYEAAHLVRYVMSKTPGVTPVDLVKMGEASIFEQVFEDTFSAWPSLLAAYDEFLEYTLFDDTSGLDSRVNKLLERQFHDKTAIKFEVGSDGKAKTPMVKDEINMQVPAKFSAAFHTFSADGNASLVINKPTSAVTVYVVDRTRKGRGFVIKAAVDKGGTGQVQFTTGDYVLVVGTATIPRDITFEYQAIYTPLAQVNSSFPIFVPLPTTDGSVPDKSIYTGFFNGSISTGNNALILYISSMAAGGTGPTLFEHQIMGGGTIKLVPNKEGILAGSTTLEYESACEKKNDYAREILSEQVQVQAIPESGRYRIILQVNGKSSETLVK